MLFLPCGQPAAVVLGPLLVGLPVHARRALVIDLETVHPDVAFAGHRVLRKHHRQRNEAAAVLGPAFQHRIVEQRELLLPNHFLDRPALDLLGKKGAHLRELGQHAQFADQALRRLEFQVLGNTSGDRLHRIDLQGQLHLPHARERIDQYGDVVTFGVFEQQRRTAPFDRPVGDLGDFEYGIDFNGDSFELAVFFQRSNEFTKVVIGH